MPRPENSNPYTGVHRLPSPYSPEPPQPSEGLPRSARRGGIKYPTGGITDGMLPTVWTDDDVIRRVVPLHKLTTEIMYDTSGTTTEHMYDTSVTTTERLYDGGVRVTPLPSGHRVEEITLEVPVSHDKLYDMLFAVDATIDNRRANGTTIPEESRTVTTIGNEIVIRWEEHS